MKTLVKGNLSAYLFEDFEVVNVGFDRTIIGNPEQFVIADCNSTNSIMYENITPPGDWAGCKYLYAGGVWTINPDYRDKPSHAG